MCWRLHEFLTPIPTRPDSLSTLPSNGTPSKTTRPNNLVRLQCESLVRLRLSHCMRPERWRCCSVTLTMIRKQRHSRSPQQRVFRFIVGHGRKSKTTTWRLNIDLRWGENSRRQSDARHTATAIELATKS